MLLEYVVNLVCDMTVPGRYSIVATVPYWEGPTQSDAARKVACSTPIEVVITGAVPRSPSTGYSDQFKIDEPPLITVTLDSARADYTPLEPIKTRFKIKNVSDQPIYLRGDRGRPHGNCYFEVEAEHSGRVSRTRFGEQFTLVANPSQTKKVEPGAEFEGELVVNWAVDMSLPDRYKVVLAVPYWSPNDRNDGNQRVARSVALGVEVAGRAR